MQNLKDAMKQKLSEAGIGFEELKVFGSIKCNVHVKCVSKTTAEKWAILLSQVFNGANVSVVKTMWDAKENKGTCLLPTKRFGYLVAVAA
jgi:hypothetical protein